MSWRISLGLQDQTQLKLVVHVYTTCHSFSLVSPMFQSNAWIWNDVVFFFFLISLLVAVVIVGLLSWGLLNCNMSTPHRTNTSRNTSTRTNQNVPHVSWAVNSYSYSRLFQNSNSFSECVSIEKKNIYYFMWFTTLCEWYGKTTTTIVVCLRCLLQ